MKVMSILSLYPTHSSYLLLPLFHYEENDFSHAIVLLFTFL